MRHKMSHNTNFFHILSWRHECSLTAKLLNLSPKPNQTKFQIKNNSVEGYLLRNKQKKNTKHYRFYVVRFISIFYSVELNEIKFLYINLKKNQTWIVALRLSSHIYFFQIIRYEEFQSTDELLMTQKCW